MSAFSSGLHLAELTHHCMPDFATSLVNTLREKYQFSLLYLFQKFGTVIE